MPLSRSRDYLSIGEVLDSLRGDFPDVTISKIRFLEAEGLIAPQRTASGYRMFYEGDLARLKYILSLQRDHFMPLKVIRDRLHDADATGGVGAAEPAKPAKAAKTGKGSKGSKAKLPAPPPIPPAADGDGLGETTGVQLTRAELIKTTGLAEAELQSLEEYGLLAPSEAGNYDGAAVVCARAAKRFFEFGVEARHLKMYRQFADREVAFFEQIVSPVTRRKDPGAQDEATRSVRELAGLARQMRDATLRASLQELL
jgi:DNA-binding transcriptional MerR regulator